jgi:hypothetical protein
VVERLALEKRHIEFVGDQGRTDVPAERRVAFDRRQLARAAAFVGDRVAVIDAEHEGRIVIEEEGSDVIVEDHQQHIRLVLGEPALHRREGLEDRRPDRVVLVVPVVGESDGGRMRTDPGHGFLPLRMEAGRCGGLCALIQVKEEKGLGRYGRYSRSFGSSATLASPPCGE